MSVSYHHGIKLFLHAEVNLLASGARFLQREGVKQERSSVGSHMGVGHLEGTPEEGIVESQDHLRHSLLVLLLVDVAQQLEE